MLLTCVNIRHWDIQSHYVKLPDYSSVTRRGSCHLLSQEKARFASHCPSFSSIHARSAFHEVRSISFHDCQIISCAKHISLLGSAEPFPHLSMREAHFKICESKSFQVRSTFQARSAFHALLCKAFHSRLRRDKNPPETKLRRIFFQSVMLMCLLNLFFKFCYADNITRVFLHRRAYKPLKP